MHPRKCRIASVYAADRLGSYREGGDCLSRILGGFWHLGGYVFMKSQNQLPFWFLCESYSAVQLTNLPTWPLLGSVLLASFFFGGSAGKESACNVGDPGSIPGLGRSPGEGKGCPLQCSGLENSLNSIVHGVTKSQTRLSDFPSSSLALKGE